MSVFRENQTFRRDFLALAVVLPAVVALWLFHRLPAVAGLPAGVGFWATVILACPAALLIVWIFSIRLETELGPQAIELMFHRLGARKAIPYEAIADVEVVDYRPFADHWGWGIRLTFGRESAWTARGGRGVRFSLADGRKVLVGSQEPERLAEAVRRRLAARAPRAA